MISDNESDERWMVSLLEGKKIYRMRLPQITTMMHCAGSSGGWLIMKDTKTGDPFGLNPMTGSTFRLPGITKLPWIWQVLNDDGVIRYCFDGQPTASSAESSHFRFLARFFFHLDSSSSTAAVVVAFCFAGKRAVFCRPSAGDQLWKELRPTRTNQIFSFSSAIFHKGSLYVVNGFGGLTIYDDLVHSGDCTPRTLHDGTSIPRETVFLYSEYKYLVESSSDHQLLLVYRHMITDDGYYVTKKMRIYKLIQAGDGGWQWSRVESLMDEAIFVGMNQAMCFSTRDHPYLTPNSIYFTDDSSYNILIHRDDKRKIPLRRVYPGSDEDTDNDDDNGEIPTRKWRSHDTGVYHLQDGSISPLDLGEEQHPWPFPIWFTPVFNGNVY